MNVLGWLEADMARHMLLEFPLLLLLGWLLPERLPGRLKVRWQHYDQYGLTGWTAFGAVIGYWMIPAALDDALSSPIVNGAKHASLIGAAALLKEAMGRSPVIVEAFFAGNIAWMGAAVGMVYMETDVQLCLNYLADSQWRAGAGLVAVSAASPIVVAVTRWRPWATASCS